MPVDFFLFLNNLLLYDVNRSIFDSRMSNRNLDVVETLKKMVELFIYFFYKKPNN